MAGDAEATVEQEKLTQTLALRGSGTANYPQKNSDKCNDWKQQCAS
jgi:hypothetical protein